MKVTETDTDFKTFQVYSSWNKKVISPIPILDFKTFQVYSSYWYVPAPWY